MTAEEKKAAAKAREEKFLADVEATRKRIKQRTCPTCKEPGTYTGMVRIADENYSVSFRCIIDHRWNITAGALEAHALRPVPACHGLPIDKHRWHQDGSGCLDCGLPRREAVTAETSTPILMSGLCGLCQEPFGKNYYAGVPTEAGKLDLCMKCWEAHRAAGGR